MAKDLLYLQAEKSAHGFISGKQWHLVSILTETEHSLGSLGLSLLPGFSFFFYYLNFTVPGIRTACAAHLWQGLMNINSKVAVTQYGEEVGWLWREDLSMARNVWVCGLGQICCSGGIMVVAELPRQQASNCQWSGAGITNTDTGSQVPLGRRVFLQRSDEEFAIRREWAVKHHWKHDTGVRLCDSQDMGVSHSHVWRTKGAKLIF